MRGSMSVTGYDSSIRTGNLIRNRDQPFLYNNANPYILGCLIEKKCGQNMREYLRYRLFEPIGIHNVEWTSCPMGHTIAANALQLNIDEVGRFGQLLVNGGVFNGKRILSEEYVKDMTTSYSTTGEFIPAIRRLRRDTVIRPGSIRSIMRRICGESSGSIVSCYRKKMR